MPEILCLWAVAPRDLARHNIKHLAGQIQQGDWAGRGVVIERCHLLALTSLRLSPPEGDYLQVSLPTTVNFGAYRLAIEGTFPDARAFNTTNLL